MEIGDILKETNPEIGERLEKLRIKLLRQETSYERLKKELLKDPEVKREYDKLEPKYKKIRKRLNKKKEEKNEKELATRKLEEG